MITLFIFDEVWIGEAAEAVITFVICAAVALGSIAVIVVPAGIIVALVSCLL